MVDQGWGSPSWWVGRAAQKGCQERQEVGEHSACHRLSGQGSLASSKCVSGGPKYSTTARMWWWGFGCGECTHGSPHEGGQRWTNSWGLPTSQPALSVDEAIERASLHTQSGRQKAVRCPHTLHVWTQPCTTHAHVKLFSEGCVCAVLQARTLLTWLLQGGLETPKQLLTELWHRGFLV